MVAVFTSSLILVKEESVLDLIAKDTRICVKLLLFLTGIVDI